MASKQRTTKEDNEARDVEINKAVTALTPWRPAEQRQPDLQTKGGDTFRFVNGMPEQRWVRDGGPILRDNSFWRSLARAHGGNQDLWPIYKYQVSDYVLTILDLANSRIARTHPRAVLYTVLNGHAGGRTEEHLQRKPADLIAQCNDADAPVSSELYQVVADLYSIELLIIYLKDGATSDKTHSLVSRGQGNHRQVFLTCYSPPENKEISSSENKTNSGPFYQPVLPAVSEPWDFKFSAHMEGDKSRVNTRRCPFVFSAGNAGERIMPGIPESSPRVPPPPIVPAPVPKSVGKKVLEGFFHFQEYQGPIGQGRKVVPEHLTALALARKSSVKGGAQSSLGRTPSTQGRISRTPSVGAGSPGPAPVKGKKTGEHSRPPLSGTGRTPISGHSRAPSMSGKTPVTGHSRTPSASGSPAPGTNRGRRGSSVGQDSRPAFNAGPRVELPGRTRTPSISGSPAPTANIPIRARSGSKNTDRPAFNAGPGGRVGIIGVLEPPPVSGRTSVSGRSRTPSVSKGKSLTPAKKSMPKSTVTGKSSTSGKPEPNTQRQIRKISNSGPELTPSPAKPSAPIPIPTPSSTTIPTRNRRSSSVSSIPAPAQTTRRTSFSRPEVICRIRTPSPPLYDEQGFLTEDEDDDEEEEEEEVPQAVGRRKPVIDGKKPPPAWANKRVVGYGEIPKEMGGGG